MKNLPEKFPIRYALVTYDIEVDEFEDPALRDAYLREQKNLFIQYVLKLQSCNDLSSDYHTIQIHHLSDEILNVKSLNYDPNDIDEFMNLIESLKKELAHFLNTDKDKILSSWGKGYAFDPYLYSYAGSGEKPAFLQAYNKLLNPPKDLYKISVSKSDINFFYGLYQKIRDGKISAVQLYEKLNQYNKPIYISTHYSKNWAVADSGKTDGIFITRNKIGSGYNELLKEVENQNFDFKINIVVCRNWEELFAEEIMQIYRMSNFCGNCGKALPFDYQGKFCPPELPENADCIRERARQRARKSSQD